MVKSLVNKLINKIKKGALIAAAVASLGVAGCDLNGPKPVPNYAPVASLSVIPTEGESPSPTNITLDGEDEDGKEDIVQYKLTIDYEKALDPSPIISTSPITLENYMLNDSATIIGQVTDSRGAVSNIKEHVTLLEPSTDYLDVEGYLQDCESDTGKQGKIKIYDSLGNPIGETIADSTGYFSLHTNKPITELSSVVLKVISTDVSNSQNSYVRTKTFPAGDVSINPIRVVPYGNLTPDEIPKFIEHMERVNFGFRNGLAKWNQGELSDEPYRPIFKGIQISDDFSLTMQDNIKNAIKNSGYPKAGKINIVVGKTYALTQGWGFIRPSIGGEAPGTAVYEQYGPDGISDGYIERFETNITNNWWPESKSLVNHEAFHGKSYPGHADSESETALFNSIMKYTGVDNRYSPKERPEVLTPADIKGSYIIDEETYSGLENKGNILGTSF